MTLLRSVVLASVAILLVGQAAHASTIEYSVLYKITTDVDNGGTVSSLVGEMFSGNFWVDPVTRSWNPGSGNPESGAHVDFSQIGVIWDTSVPGTGILGGDTIDLAGRVDGTMIGPPAPGGMEIVHSSGSNTFDILEDGGNGGERIVYSGDIVSVTEVPEPMSLTLLGTGWLALLCRRRRAMKVIA